MKTKDWIVLLLLTAFDVLFYRQLLGVNVLVFSLLILFFSLYEKPQLKHSVKWRLVAGALLITSGSALLYGDFLSFFATLVTLAIMASMLTDEGTSAGVALAGTALSYVCSPYYLLVHYVNRLSEWQQTKDKYGIAKIVLTVLVLLIVTVFFFIYREANTFFYLFTRNINLNFISFSWVFFTLNGLLLIFTFFHFRHFQFFRKQIDVAPALLEGDSCNSGQFMNIPVNAGLELYTGRLLLLLLNVLLLVVNALDFKYFLVSKMPEGVSYADYLHQGVGMLIFSIILAISIILFFFRGRLNFSESNRWIKILAYIWIVQNVLMVISTLFRNQMYVNAYGLTEKRMGVYIYLALCVAGLFITLFKIMRRYSNAYYIRLISWIFYAVLVFSCPVNWDGLITRFNLARKDAIDNFDYLQTLSENNRPLLLQFAKEHSTMVKDSDHYINPQSLDRNRYYIVEEHSKHHDWQSWTLSKKKILQYILNEKTDRLSFSNLYPLDGSVLTYFPDLKALKAANGNVIRLHYLYKLTQLKRLELIDCDLTDVSFVYQQGGLEYLDVSGNKIKNLTPLYSLTNLKTLVISKPAEKDRKVLESKLINTQIIYK
jgi:hypothetical protein